MSWAFTPPFETVPCERTRGAKAPAHILIDQGTSDQFLADQQLLPERFSAAASKSGQRFTLRMQQGYDHCYYHIQTFMADHLRHHAKLLKN
jgi:S-formylglutathione hydrolase